MNNNGWITDRLPEKQDGDIIGYVWVWDESHKRPIQLGSTCVALGTPWQPIIKPKPYIKPRWKPKEGEQYWAIQSIQWPTSEGLCVRNHKWVNDTFNDNNYKSGNCFQTREEAEEMVDKFKQLLKEHHDGK